MSVKDSGLVECDIVSLGEWIATFRRRNFPSELWAATQQPTLRHTIQDLDLQPSDLFNNLAQKAGSRKALLIFVLEVSGSNPHLNIYSPN